MWRSFVPPRRSTLPASAAPTRCRDGRQYRSGATSGEQEKPWRDSVFRVVCGDKRDTFERDLAVELAFADGRRSRNRLGISTVRRRTPRVARISSRKLGALRGNTSGASVWKTSRRIMKCRNRIGEVDPRRAVQTNSTSGQESMVFVVPRRSPRSYSGYPHEIDVSGAQALKHGDEQRLSCCISASMQANSVPGSRATLRDRRQRAPAGRYGDAADENVTSPIALATSAVPSGELSSTNNNSQSQETRTRETASTRIGTLARSLYVGPRCTVPAPAVAPYSPLYLSARLSRGRSGSYGLQCSPSVHRQQLTTMLRHIQCAGLNARITREPYTLPICRCVDC